MTTANKTFPATVVKVLETDRVVINRGTQDGVAVGQQYIVYILDNDVLVDPSTGEELGRLEIIKGVGRVTQVQDRIAVLFHETGDFAGPRIGDIVKPV
jgi:hypothetical protein